MINADLLGENNRRGSQPPEMIEILWIKLLKRMRNNVYGRDACIIGEVKREPQGIVVMRTGFGGTRIVDMLVGGQLPRIC